MHVGDHHFDLSSKLRINKFHRWLDRPASPRVDQRLITSCWIQVVVLPASFRTSIVTSLRPSSRRYIAQLLVQPALVVWTLGNLVRKKLVQALVRDSQSEYNSRRVNGSRKSVKKITIYLITQYPPEPWLRSLLRAPCSPLPFSFPVLQSTRPSWAKIISTDIQAFHSLFKLVGELLALTRSCALCFIET